MRAVLPVTPEMGTRVTMLTNVLSITGIAQSTPWLLASILSGLANVGPVHLDTSGTENHALLSVDVAPITAAVILKLLVKV